MVDDGGKIFFIPVVNQGEAPLLFVRQRLPPFTTDVWKHVSMLPGGGGGVGGHSLLLEQLQCWLYFPHQLLSAEAAQRSACYHHVT